MADPTAEALAALVLENAELRERVARVEKERDCAVALGEFFDRGLKAYKSPFLKDRRAWEAQAAKLLALLSEAESG